MVCDSLDNHSQNNMASPEFPVYLVTQYVVFILFIFSVQYSKLQDGCRTVFFSFVIIGSQSF